jgi:hypothetical protein
MTRKCTFLYCPAELKKAKNSRKDQQNSNFFIDFGQDRCYTFNMDSYIRK